LSVNLQDVRKSLTELREGIKRIRQELTDHFSDLESNDKYGKQMWSFLGKATAKLEDLTDDVNAADSMFTEVVSYYGEDEKTMTSSEFYGVFKTFVTSYKVDRFFSHYSMLLANDLTKKCKADNQSAAEERMVADRRRQAAEEARAHRQKALETQSVDDTSVLDDLLQKLRNGDGVSRRTRRGKPGASNKPLKLDFDTSQPYQPDAGSLDTVGLARDMLAALKSDGFEAFSPPTPTSKHPRQKRRRRGSGSKMGRNTPDPHSPAAEDAQLAFEYSSNDSSMLLNESVSSNLDLSIMSADDDSGTVEGDETIHLS
jgi:cytokinesis protein